MCTRINNNVVAAIFVQSQYKMQMVYCEMVRDVSYSFILCVQVNAQNALMKMIALSTGKKRLL